MDRSYNRTGGGRAAAMSLISKSVRVLANYKSKFKLTNYPRILTSPILGNTEVIAVTGYASNAGC
jgi:hypothetical protein